MKKISIIVPIYNVEKYIERCAVSLFEQTYSDIEYIFVNDCTPDSSMEILAKTIDRYASRSKDVIIINLERNCGLENARREGLKKATGEYIKFVDSDDYMANDTIRELAENAEKNNSDIVACNIAAEYGDKTEIIREYVPQDPKAYFGEMLRNERVNGYVINKLIRRALFDKIDMNGECISYLEDLVVMIRLYYYAKIITHVDKTLYFYEQSNSNSLTKYKTEKHYRDAKTFIERTDRFLIDNKLFDQYASDYEYLKLQIKLRLFFDINSALLKKQYSHIFGEIDYTKYKLRLGERLMLFFDSHRLWHICELLRKVIAWKNKK